MRVVGPKNLKERFVYWYIGLMVDFECWYYTCILNRKNKKDL